MHRRLCDMAIGGFLLAGMLACVAGCDRKPSPSATQSATQARPTLAASVFPVADLVARVAGDRWEVVTLLPPGRNPHGYALRPAEAESLVRAKVLFAAGQGLDDWAIRAAGGINRDCKVVVLTDSLGLAEQGRAAGQEPGGHEHADGEDHEHGALDPHIWLDPVLAGRIADLAAEELIRLDPAGRESYQQNLTTLKQQIRELDDEYRQALGSCRTRTLVVFHAGYGYLSRRYGLEQVPIVTGAGAKPAEVEEVIGRIRRESIRTVYREPQFDSRWVDFVSRRSGAKVLVLDPQGHAGKEGYNSYFAMMRTNLAALKEGLDRGS